MFTKTIVTAVAIAAAAPALASTQLERSLGVEPGTFDTVQLIELQRAVADEDRARIDFILASAAPEIISTRGDAGFGLDEVHVRQIVESALEENDQHRADFVAMGGLGASGAIDAAQARLAAELGVDAGAYSLADLVRIQNERQD